MCACTLRLLLLRNVIKLHFNLKCHVLFHYQITYQETRIGKKNPYNNKFFVYFNCNEWYYNKNTGK